MILKEHEKEQQKNLTLFIRKSLKYLNLILKQYFYFTSLKNTNFKIFYVTKEWIICPTIDI